MITKAWLSPTGVLHPCSSHVEGAEKILGQSFSTSSPRAYEAMFAAGWIRIAEEEDGLARHFERPSSTAAQRKWLREHLPEKLG